MNDEKRFRLEEAQVEFARRTNGQVWNLLGLEKRTPAQDREMILAAYASLYHWLYAGTIVHQQRGEWMLAHVYSVLERDEPALAHAMHCLELTEANPDAMKDFDFSYAYEGMARALALSGKHQDAREFLAKAEATGELIADQQDRDIFMGDLLGGNWFGIR